MEKFDNYKCKVYPHEQLNPCKSVIRIRGLILTTEDEIKAALYKQSITKYKRISIRKNGETIHTDI